VLWTSHRHDPRDSSNESRSPQNREDMNSPVAFWLARSRAKRHDPSRWPPKKWNLELFCAAGLLQQRSALWRISFCSLGTTMALPTRHPHAISNTKLIVRTIDPRKEYMKDVPKHRQQQRKRPTTTGRTHPINSASTTITTATDMLEDSRGNVVRLVPPRGAS